MGVHRDEWGSGWAAGWMFRGEAEYALDEKGRVVIPPNFRSVMGERVIATRGASDPCIWVYSQTEWPSVEEKLRALPFRFRDFARMMRASADCDVDRQGRISLPSSLRKYAHISRAVTIIGMGNRLEIWSTPVWQARLNKIVKAPQALAKQIEELNL
ncbi:MAG TPA: division/cell wall cluster transcriptional repressor MraZ [bacterium]|nr:division/cell wall cluster transcriptional repressor MraZ [bacterium]